MVPMTLKKKKKIIAVSRNADKIILNSLNCSQFIIQHCDFITFQRCAVQLWPINSLPYHIRCMLFTYYIIIIYYTSINGSWTNYDGDGDVLTCHNNNIIIRYYCNSNTRIFNTCKYNIKSHHNNAYNKIHIIIIIIIVTQFIFWVKIQLA